MDIWELSDCTFERFSRLPGSDQIATRNALRWILKLAHDKTPLSILEIGAGIGTITAHLFSAEMQIESYYALERNQWCRTAFDSNVSPFERLTLIESLNEIPDRWNPNFVIVDDIMELDEVNWLIDRVLKATVVIEGHRIRQRIQIVRCLQSSGVSFKYRNVGKSTDSYKGVGIIELDRDKKSSKNYYILSMVLLHSHLAFLEWRSLRAKIPLRRLIGGKI